MSGDQTTWDCPSCGTVEGSCGRHRCEATPPGWHPLDEAKRAEKVTPMRVQRRRVKGWRAPAGAVYVGRGTIWGNECIVGEAHPETGRPMTAEDVVAFFRANFPKAMQDGARRVLRGRPLMCWCPLDRPCHADALLEWANR